MNLGELVPNDNGKSSIDVTTDLQAFGLIITAEPYFAVTHPSDVVVAENIVLQDTKGFEQPIDAHFDTLEGGEYTIDMPAEQLPSLFGSAEDAPRSAGGTQRRGDRQSGRRGAVRRVQPGESH